MSSVLVPAGKYVLGDPCYSVRDEKWMELLQSCDYFDSPEGTVDGFKVYAFGTAYGDGTYWDQYGREYPVDAGLIGLVPIEFMEKDGFEIDESLTHVVEFQNAVWCFKEDAGILRFGQIEIDTSFEEEEYDDYDDYECEDGEE